MNSSLIRSFRLLACARLFWFLVMISTRAFGVASLPRWDFQLLTQWRPLIEFLVCYCLEQHCIVRDEYYQRISKTHSLHMMGKLERILSQTSSNNLFLGLMKDRECWNLTSSVYFRTFLELVLEQKITFSVVLGLLSPTQLS